MFSAPIICWKLLVVKKPSLSLSSEGIFYPYPLWHYQEGELLLQYYVRVGKSGGIINPQRDCVVAKAWLTFWQFQIFQWKVINIFPPHSIVIHIWHGVRWISYGCDNPTLWSPTLSHSILVPTFHPLLLGNHVNKGHHVRWGDIFKPQVREWLFNLIHFPFGRGTPKVIITHIEFTI